MMLYCEIVPKMLLLSEKLSCKVGFLSLLCLRPSRKVNFLFTYNEGVRGISSLLDNNELVFYWVLILLQVNLLLFAQVAFYVLHKLFALDERL